MLLNKQLILRTKKHNQKIKRTSRSVAALVASSSLAPSAYLGRYVKLNQELAKFCKLFFHWEREYEKIFYSYSADVNFR